MCIEYTARKLQKKKQKKKLLTTTINFVNNLAFHCKCKYVGSFSKYHESLLWKSLVSKISIC